MRVSALSLAAAALVVVGGSAIHVATERSNGITFTKAQLERLIAATPDESIGKRASQQCQCSTPDTICCYDWFPAPRGGVWECNPDAANIC